MKIIINRHSVPTFIDTEDMDIIEVMDMFVGALAQEGYHIDSIRRGFEKKAEEFQSLMKEET